LLYPHLASQEEIQRMPKMLKRSSASPVDGFASALTVQYLSSG
jgi:hypothetical protein